MLSVAVVAIGCAVWTMYVKPARDLRREGMFSWAAWLDRVL